MSLFPFRESCWRWYLSRCWSRQIQRDPCTRYRIHSELCTYHQKRISRTQRYGLCQKCPSDGCFPSSDHICTYPAKYGPVPSFDGSNRFQQRRSLRGRHELSRIGVQPPDASLGRMLSESQTYLMTAPWGSVFPGLAVILLALGVSLLGDGLQKKGGN